MAKRLASRRIHPRELGILPEVDSFNPALNQRHFNGM